MLRAIRWGIVIAAAVCAGPLLAACNDYADDCNNLGTCPLPDAGDASADAD
jgi:hypothetical protein